MSAKPRPASLSSAGQWVAAGLHTPAYEDGAQERFDVHKVGMTCFLVSEAAFFSTLLMAYVAYLGKNLVGPTPEEALSLPLVIGNTICLLASSATVHHAGTRFARGSLAEFVRWWGATILLGTIFLAGTAYEWHDLYTRHGLTPSRNLFGSTYYTLVGFHALHVTVGVVVMMILLVLTWRHRISPREPIAVELASWYWHFVDCVWVVVFAVVYLIGR